MKSTADIQNLISEEPEYRTLIVSFSKPIRVLDEFFDNPQWGGGTLKKWIDSYESTRFTPIDEYTAVITSEYNMAFVKEWLAKYIQIAEQREF